MSKSPNTYDAIEATSPANNGEVEDSVDREAIEITDGSFRMKGESNKEKLLLMISQVKDFLTPAFIKLRAFLYWCKKWKIYLIFLIIPFIIANHLYISCDEYCPYTSWNQCLIQYYNRKIRTWLTKISLTAFIFAALILVPFYYRKIVPLFVSFVTIINVIYLVFFFDNVLNGTQYGQALAFLLVLDLSVLFTLFGILRMIIFCFRKKPKLTVISVILFLGCLSAWLYFVKYKGSCDHWAKGLGGDQINNDVTCVIKTPEICHYDILEGLLDLSFWDCPSFKPDRELMDKYYPLNAPIIGLPRIEGFPDLNRTWTYIQSSVMSGAKSFESFEDPAAKDLEIFIDQRDKDNIKLVIDLKKNQTLIDERKKLQDNEGMAQNLLVIFIDTLSRARLYKKLPRTAAWFDKYYNGKSSERESYQFFKFHAITPYTVNNMLAFNFGVVPDFWSGTAPIPETEDLKPHNYVGGFKKKGYITGRSADVCDAFCTMFERDLPLIKDTPFDHEGQTLACDPNHRHPMAILPAWKGQFSMRRRCIYGIDVFQGTLRYADQFMRAYADEKKMFFMEFLDAHEATQEAIKYLDRYLVKFLENLDKDGLFKDTMILLWSDHGNHMSAFPFNLVRETRLKELALPTLIMVLPPGMIPKYGEALKSNQQKLFSAYQLHYLMTSFPNGLNSPDLKLSPLSPLPILTCRNIKVFRQPCACIYPKKK